MLEGSRFIRCWEEIEQKVAKEAKERRKRLTADGAEVRE